MAESNTFVKAFFAGNDDSNKSVYVPFDANKEIEAQVLEHANSFEKQNNE